MIQLRKRDKGGKTMDANVITQIITSVGFPIAMCCALLWYIKVLTEDRKKETEQFTEALNKNTLVLQKLCDKMNVERED